MARIVQAVHRAPVTLTRNSYVANIADALVAFTTTMSAASDLATVAFLVIARNASVQRIALTLSQRRITGSVIAARPFLRLWANRTFAVQSHEARVAVARESRVCAYTMARAL